MSLDATNLRYLICGILAVMLAVMLTAAQQGCTIAPREVVVPGQASFSGTSQNSGMLGLEPVSGSEIISGGARSNYNALVGVYGAKYLPPLRPDDGITGFTNGTYLLDKSHLFAYLQMCVWHRNGR